MAYTPISENECIGDSLVTINNTFTSLDTKVDQISAKIPTTVSSTEIGYLNGVTSNVQTQIDTLDTRVDGVSSRIPSTISSTEIGRLDGVTSNIQDQLDDKVDGSGTVNYVPKFTPDGNTLGNSNLIDQVGYTEGKGKFYISGAESNNSTYNSPGELAIKSATSGNDPLITFHNTSGARQGYLQFGDTFGRLRLSAYGDLAMGTNNQDTLLSLIHI